MVNNIAIANKFAIQNGKQPSRLSKLTCIDYLYISHVGVKPGLFEAFALLLSMRAVCVSSREPFDQRPSDTCMSNVTCLEVEDGAFKPENSESLLSRMRTLPNFYYGDGSREEPAWDRDPLNSTSGLLIDLLV